MVEVDHKLLEYLKTKQISNPKLLRFSLQIQEYVFDIKSMHGSQNMIADIQSRY